MANTGISHLNDSMQKTNEWLAEVAEKMHSDTQKAYQATRSVFHALRDRLTLEEAMDLAAQLPLVLKGVFFDGYSPAGKPEKIKTKQEFIEKVEAEAHDKDLDPFLATDAVLDVLKEKVSGGEIEDVRVTLPEDLKGFFAEE